MQLEAVTMSHNLSQYNDFWLLHKILKTTREWEQEPSSSQLIFTKSPGPLEIWPKLPQSFSSSLQSQLQFFFHYYSNHRNASIVFPSLSKTYKRGKAATTTRRQINTLKMVIIKNLHLWEYFESTSDFRVLRSFNYDKIHIHSSLLNQDSLVSFTETFHKEILNLPVVFLSKQMTEKKISPIKVIENSANYIKTMSYLYPKGS